MKEILLASTNKQKFIAVESAAKIVYPNEVIRVRGAAAQSEIHQQPFGLEETKLGAENRLKNALAANFAVYDLAISIENGLFPEGNDAQPKYIDRAIIIAQRSDGKRRMELSEGVEFPRDVVEELMKTPNGFAQRTVGSLLHERNLAVNENDPHTFLTHGERSRIELLMNTLVYVLRNLERE